MEQSHRAPASKRKHGREIHQSPYCLKWTIVSSRYWLTIFTTPQEMNISRCFPSCLVVWCTGINVDSEYQTAYECFKVKKQRHSIMNNVVLRIRTHSNVFIPLTMPIKTNKSSITQLRPWKINKHYSTRYKWNRPPQKKTWNLELPAWLCSHLSKKTTT